MKVWLYYRLSRDEDDELNSLTNQRKIIYEYAVMTEHLVDNDGKLYRRYRLRTCDPTRFVETLDYDIECPHCHDQLRLCGMAVDAMTHGLYRCKRCDDEAERRR